VHAHSEQGRGCDCRMGGRGRAGGTLCAAQRQSPCGGGWTPREARRGRRGAASSARCTHHLLVALGLLGELGHVDVVGAGHAAKQLRHDLTSAVAATARGRASSGPIARKQPPGPPTAPGISHEHGAAPRQLRGSHALRKLQSRVHGRATGGRGRATPPRADGGGMVGHRLRGRASWTSQRSRNNTPCQILSR